MNISKVKITVELDEKEIWDIIIPMLHDLKRSAEHYIKHYDGKSEDEFIAYVTKNNVSVIKLFESFSKVIDRSDMMNEVTYHCKELLKSKLEVTNE